MLYNFPIERHETRGSTTSKKSIYFGKCIIVFAGGENHAGFLSDSRPGGTDCWIHDELSSDKVTQSERYIVSNSHPHVKTLQVARVRASLQVTVFTLGNAP
jgi:hypothetical protein